MDRDDQMDVLLTGIGGQGIQLMAKTLALAATDEGKEVMLSASYGAEMRGGHSDASVCIAEGDLAALPILPSANRAIVMHPMSWPGVSARLRLGSLALVNSNALGEEATLDGGRVVALPLDDLATELGAPGSASFVALGAFGGLTGIVGPESLRDAMRRLVPPYRAALIESNETAIDRGYEEGRSRRSMELLS